MWYPAWGGGYASAEQDNQHSICRNLEVCRHYTLSTVSKEDCDFYLSMTLPWAMLLNRSTRDFFFPQNHFAGI